MHVNMCIVHVNIPELTWGEGSGTPTRVTTYILLPKWFNHEMSKWFNHCTHTW